MIEKKQKTNPFMQTMPFVMAGSLTLGLGATSADNYEESQPQDDRTPFNGAKAKIEVAERPSNPIFDVQAVTLQTSDLTYIVKRGDTISSIASKHGLSTANVLALNGLGWSSLIFPGQKIVLKKGNSAPKTSTPAPKAPATSSGTYTVKSGDTVSRIASKHGVSTQSVLDLNGLKWSSIIYPKQVLKIPGKASTSTPAPKPADPPKTSTPAPKPGNSGVTTYTVKSGDTVSGIASKHGVTTKSVLDLNGLKMSSIIYPKQVLKIPGKGTTTPTPAPKPVDPAPAPESNQPSQPAPSTCTGVSYVIVSGDTVTKIANKFGVTIKSILDANGLSMNSIIYTGQKLEIPGVTAITDDCQVHATMTEEMRRNAQIIVDVGRAAGVPEYGLVIALATAMQESSLRNLDYGDRDSVGLFQQRPSTGWGTVEEIMDPVRSAKAFFGGHVNPNPGKTRGLLDISGWQNMPLTKAAQAVQISAFPNAYAKWEYSARQWLKELN